MSVDFFLRSSRWYFVLCLLVACGKGIAGVDCSTGNQCTQTIGLNPGWNAIYVKVSPAQVEPAQVFADLLDDSGPQISSAWTWLSRRSKIDFVQDPDIEALLSAPGWLGFFPPLSEKTFLTSLHAISANRPYLVKLEGDVPANLVITGQPVAPSTDWLADSLNLTGFHIDEAADVTFGDFFAASPAHANSAMYELDSALGQWVPVGSERLMNPDSAYWVYCDGGSDYAGPLLLENGDRLDFGAVLQSRVVDLRNPSGNSLDVVVTVLNNSESVLHENIDPTSDERWVALPMTTSVAEGASKRLTLGIRRSDFAPGDYAETLQIVVPGISRWLIPVTASAPPLTGLWVGAVTINEVSQANNYRHDCELVDMVIGTEEVIVGVAENGDNIVETRNIVETYGINPGAGTVLCDNADGLFLCNADGLKPGSGTTLCEGTAGFPIALDHEVSNAVASPFTFRILLHEDSNGAVRLLKDVIVMWQDGVDGGNGHYVLLTDDTLVSEFQGVKQRDGTPVGERISSVAYDFEGQTLLMGDGIGSNLSAELVLGADAPTNPFRHKYHPAHDNLEPDYATFKEEAYPVTRLMQLSFGGPGSNGVGTGYSETSGTYREEVTGLHKYPIISSGTFVLRHMVSTGELNQ